MLIRSLVLLVAFILCVEIQAQNKEERKLVQFSGVVVNNDSLQPVPFANIIIKNTRRGTMSDYYGFFSFVAQISDTIEFSCVGFQKAAFIIPDSLTTNRYSLIQMLVTDTVLLNEIDVHPWPTPPQFKEAFLSLKVADDDYERSLKNMERQKLKIQMESLPMSSKENYYYQMQQRQSQLYYAGQYPTLSLMNPIAWAKFIEAWRRGDFKRKDKK